MPSVWVSRGLLAIDLRTYGEDAVAEAAAALSDEQMGRIAKIGGRHALTGMLLAKATALAAVEVVEGAARPLRRRRRRLKGIYPGH